ncbi:hypothetical protein [Microbulbifer yueqingensis]|uniref:Lipoprotein n=1 Tax=Microbulbifer yueqingensis TaxID=658219 RepID=A0A1G8Y4U1_9GAMM|nr:hypothetical protein [Microbulbifer yueqingensis]SDJ97414.1 hypothetical protein SAMN05216212_1347 [Microbulbifer yueqingensis]
MQFYRAAVLSLIMAVAGCGYLPSELSGGKKPAAGAHARVVARPHSVSCDTPARGFRKVSFARLYQTTGDRKEPFRESADLPAQYDVDAYVWGYRKCHTGENCTAGDHYWLIERGPGDDFEVWVVTPQYPRIAIQSSCRDRLKVGQRYRFSFSRGQLVGFSR